MSGGGNLLAELAPLGLMAIPGVGEALAPTLMGAGLGTTAADALSTGLIGAAASGGIGALTGAKDPLKSALIGGIGAGLGNYAMGPGGFDLVGDGATGAADAAGSGSLGSTSPLSDVSNSTGFSAGYAPGDLGGSTSGLGAGAAIPSSTDLMYGSAGAAVPSDPSLLSQLGHYAVNNPLKTAIAGDLAITGAQALMPKKQVNVAQNAAAVKATDPSFYDPTLPAYHAQNTATPYTGNWYTYGQQAQSPMFTSQVVPGAAPYKRGGQVRKYAAGGPVNPLASAPTMPPAMPPQGTQQAAPVNPLAIQAAHNAGVAIGQHLKSKMKTPPGKVNGPGGGQDDAVPAKLSQGEYVLSADIPSALGDGSTDDGAKKLDQFVANIRAHKTSNKGKFPPKAHNPLSYLPKGSV